MTKIEWTHRPGTVGVSWNPFRARNLATGGVGHFCVHVSPGCENCYAERMQTRFQNPVRYAAQDRAKVDLFLDEKTLAEPLRWRAPRTVFVCSMTDLFLEHHSDEQIDRVFAVMALCPRHIFIVLTKRAARMREYCSQEGLAAHIWDSADGLACDLNLSDLHPSAHYLLRGKRGAPWPLPNVWFGVSVEDQARADERIPILLDTSAALRFISVEPLLGPVDLTRIEWERSDDGAPCSYGLGGIMEEDGAAWSEKRLHWIIVGGESGPSARPMESEWALRLRKQCDAAGVMFFMKQMARKAPIPPELMIREFPA